jgi:acyl carrier protein
METGRTIGERVKGLVATHLEVSLDKVSEASSFIDLGADSLDTIELATVLEDEFGCYVDDDELAKLQTVGDAISFVMYRIEPPSQRRVRTLI